LGNGTPRLTEAEIDIVNYGVTMRAQELVANGDTLDNVMGKLYGTISTNGPDKIGTLNDSISYALGFKYGKGVLFRKLSLTNAMLIGGLEDFLLDRPSRLSEAAEMKLLAQMYEEKQREMKSEEERHQAELAFMDSITKSPDLSRLKNGIVYDVLNEGKGAKPESDDVVTLHIRAFFVGESEPYSDSRTTESPMMVTVSESMPAFVDVLQMMKIGSTWRLYIPEDVAFANAPPNIKKRPIIFEIDLIAIDSE
jgi:FKBP-type peptidyl-prolyl cis-trans isomerase